MTATEAARTGRRRFLAGAGAAALCLPALPRRAGATPPARIAATGAVAPGRYALCLLDGGGRAIRHVPLPDRGHGFALDPVRRMLVGFARRPGRFAVAVPLDGGPARFFDCPVGRHFYGHGIFSADGGRLFACENDFEAGRGTIGIYEAGAGFSRLGELNAGGVGPHQIDWLPDGRTLAVAVGGIETHPDYGRAKLNLATMAPAVVLLDSRDGRILARGALPPELHRLSLRHLAVDRRGRVWIGGQYEGPQTDLPPLLALFENGRLRSLDMDTGLAGRYRNYVGSVTANADGSLIATSSPRGGVVTLWDAATERPLASHDLPDACGLAAWGGGFLATGGLGDLLHLTAHGAAPLRRLDTAWDNHAMAV